MNLCETCRHWNTNAEWTMRRASDGEWGKCERCYSATSDWKHPATPEQKFETLDECLTTHKTFGCVCHEPK